MVDERCVKCFLKTYKRLFEKFNVNERDQRFFLSFFDHVINGNYTNFAPEIQRNLNKTFCRLIGVDDPFSDEKEDNNRVALELYDKWKPRVIESNNPFNLALRLAIAGNIMDYGANSDFDIHKTINSVLDSSFAIDKSKELKQQLLNAEQVLYLGDNAGEIVFDRLFIETIMHGNITYAVKGGPVLNDVTIDDSIQIGMHYAADVISNGYDAPSTILERCSDEFLRIYNSADLIISKGQGNMEGLLDNNDPRIFFLLMVKCDLIAETLGVKKGDFVVHNFS
ncbi:MAG: ARMT1-like domain-containing protein [Bacteroidales bacterium]|jgi:uncharacterized protein with ATP-grasp and redox domains|nr:ARMT1-like domain-containing protein [Bacteroidales bacterium]MDD4383704.1 ARMT1-like domain-containing protein [Bacteroidales bacterium]MDY0196235.1 ARMT1-like domain-containing protein [Tenuifilaceae bacterium]